MWRIIRWLLFAGRSITLAELEAGLCLETSISSWHDFEGNLKFLYGLSSDSLAHKNKSVLSTKQLGIPSKHFQKIPSAADLDAIEMDTHSADERLAAICVQYLLRDEMFQELNELFWRMRTRSEYVGLIEDFLDQNVFLRYAIESWAFHTRLVGTPSSTLSSLVLRLLSSQARRDDIMTLTYHICKQVSWGIPHGGSRLHLAAYSNIPWFMQKYISDDRSSVHTAKTNAEDTPLIWASEMGCTECVKLLLDAGANPNDFEYDGWSALHWAARNGHLGIATMLLEHGQDGVREIGVVTHHWTGLSTENVGVSLLPSDNGRTAVSLKGLTVLRGHNSGCNKKAACTRLRRHGSSGTIDLDG